MNYSKILAIIFVALLITILIKGLPFLIGAAILVSAVYLLLGKDLNGK